MPEPGLHALIIEDELITGMGLQVLLSDLGFTSFAFASAQGQALEQARLRRPDLLTVDVGLLDGDGVAAAHAIFADVGVLPTIYVTGQAQTLAAFDPAVVLEKPIGAADLARAFAAARAEARPTA